MILVDSSVWIDYLHCNDAKLRTLLDAGQVLTHPFVIGELALGSLRQRKFILQSLDDLPQALPARDEEVMAFIERYSLVGKGIGYVDAHLLAAARLNAAPLWTRNKRLRAVAEKLKLAVA
ncbi:PIN domain-containing protein [Tahibacter caeni]|uniref:PIN domain-containing protein n=1 Tax=Tahibacter caeni TaxID=1453545 RepID=UPI00214826BB|nr:PIN domain-containing protein [Tahibacter caeni]